MDLIPNSVGRISIISDEQLYVPCLTQDLTPFYNRGVVFAVGMVQNAHLIAARSYIFCHISPYNDS